MTQQELQSYIPRPDLSEEDSLKLQCAISYFQNGTSKGQGDVIADCVFTIILQKYTVKGETNA